VDPVRVPLAQPLLLGPTLKGGQAFRWAAAEGGAFRGVAEGRAWRLAYDKDALLVEAWPALPGAEAAAWARRYFRAQDDYAAIARRLAREEHLQAPIAAWHGLRLLQTDPWECLLGFVTSIHDSVAAIETRIGRLCRHFGAPLRAPGFPRGWTHATPTPERVARAHEARLRSAAGMGFRARYLKAAARMVVQGDLPLAELGAMPYAEAHEVLLRVPGVGDKVADCVQLYGLGHLEAFPVDRWILRAMQARYTPSAKPRDIVAFAQQRWGRDAGYAQQFLFHHDRLAAQPAAARRASST
jgi:N-glycosylase/DNA lyase